MPRNKKKDKELDPQKVAIGNRIELIRTTENMSKEELAKILDITGQHMGKVIGGEVGLSVEKVIELSEKTDFSTDFILLGRTKSVDDEIKKLIKLAVQHSERTCDALKKLSAIIK